MIERKTREYWMIRVPDRDPNGVMNALSTVRSQFEEHWDMSLRQSPQTTVSSFRHCLTWRL